MLIKNYYKNLLILTISFSNRYDNNDANVSDFDLVVFVLPATDLVFEEILKQFDFISNEPGN